MIVHIVVWKYRDETPKEKRDEHRAKLRALPDKISNIVSFDLGADILNLDRSYDTGLTSVFQDLDALNSYTIHPAHQEVAAMGKEIAEHVVSVDFEK